MTFTAYLRDSTRVPRRRLLIYYSNRHTPSGQSRVHRVTKCNCVPMAFTAESPPAPGPVNLKVIPNECCLGRSPWTNKYCLKKNQNAPRRPRPSEHPPVRGKFCCCCCCLHIKNRSDLYPVPLSSSKETNFRGHKLT